MRSNKWITRIGTLSAAVTMLTACTPEAERVRGGGPGGDVGNRADTVEMHGDTDVTDRIYYQTPTRGLGIETSREAEEDA